AAAPGRGRAAPAPRRRALRRGHRRPRRPRSGAVRAGQARRVRGADAHRAEGGGRRRPAAAGGPGVPGGLRASRRHSRTAADEHAEGRPRLARRLTGADAVKIGMLSTAGIIAAVAERLIAHRQTRLVLDPVMIAKSGDPLLRPDARDALIATLLPLAEVVTPNLHEASMLAGMEVTTE